ncbi:MAG: hypothetical protein ACXWSD_20805, partial [Bdellovibrionota bacterium]
MRTWGIAVLALISAGVGAAQKGGSTTAPPASGSPGTPPTRSRTPFPNDSGPGQRPIFISGTVVLSDGLPLTERVKIERVCSGAPRTETYTDKKGHFSFQVGQSLEMPDASTSSAVSG